MNKGKLTFICGKMAAGKSTLASELASKTGALLISEDEWLATLYPNEIKSFDDYLTFSSRLKSILGPHIQSILSSGLSVVMDFPANTPKQRDWFKGIFTACDGPHELMYIEASDEICLNQLKKRQIEQPERSWFDTEDMFHHVNRFFVPPMAEEFEILVIPAK